ncbi:MAG TPA: PqqD family protein [Mariniphaga sp.]|nr:PqqD family protein [Mariniphaga sp.]
MKLINGIKISDNGFVFNSNTGDSFSLNPIGLELIRMIVEEKDFKEIKEVFLDHYEVDEFTFEKDFYEFCSLLQLYQFIDRENEPTFN